MWLAYREKRGPLNLGMRLEQLFAMSDFRRHISHGGKLTYDKFVRFHGEEADEMPEAKSLESIARLLGVPYKVKEHGK